MDDRRSDAGGEGEAAGLDSLITEARSWIEIDPDFATRAEGSRLARAAEAGDERAIAELRDAFSGRLRFGTAGLRGRLGFGPRRMNRVVVSQTSAGFAAYLHELAARGETSSPPSVVIGYDARVGSEAFARDAAAVMAGAGIEATLLPEAGPTPLTSFAVRYLGASAGVMITASHNPPRDNGYKVYLGDAHRGAQIAPPVDDEIAARIDRAAALPLSSIRRSTDFVTAGPGVQSAYVSATASAVLAGMPVDGSGLPLGASTPLSIAYTAMHGVGASVSSRIFTAAGLPKPTPVAEQIEPDGAFPTVDFPNPEEPGALDLAYRTARRIDAELVVAQDPDADRLAIAAPHPDEASGYRRLTGNQLGLLLGWRAAERERRRARSAGSEPRGTLACTIVSSPALREVAREYGLGYAETLSGFKWVSRVPGLVFGYEEALGYLTHPSVVADKDGVSASADAVAMVRELKAEGRTVWDLLDEASERFGHFASAQITLRFDSMAQAVQLSELIRSRGRLDLPGHEVERVSDLLTPGAAEVPANVLRYDLADGSRVMVRPSGTEPKLKIYLDTFSGDGSADERRTAAERALRELESAVRECVEDLRRSAAS